MNPLHLLWIVLLAGGFGRVAAAVLAVSKRGERN